MRCIKNINAISDEINKLEEEIKKFTTERSSKIEKFYDEIIKIMGSTVTLRCIKCHNQFVIPFISFLEKNHEDHCPDCRDHENALYQNKVIEVK